MSYLQFIRQVEDLNSISIINKEQEVLGYIRKVRVGAWMSWCLYLNEDCYMSASCLDEVRQMIKELNADNSKKKENSK